MTRIAELLAAGPTWSFEFFPPKTEAGAATLANAVQELATLQPSFVSVTYGALGGTRGPTRATVVRINHEQPFPAMPHLTCVGHTRADLVALLDEYQAAGIDNILALAGDPPADGSEAAGDFTFATELVDLVRGVGDFSIGAAAFPEIHPRSPNREIDRRYLAAKLEAVDFGMSQFFFEVEHYRRLVDELAELGCTKPVVPGIMPFVSVSGARRMAAMNGTEIPAWLQEQMDVVDGDAEATRRLGVQVATDLVAQLLDLGVPGVHLYALNKANSIMEIYDKLGIGPQGAPA